ncbi:MAG: element excision factor XisH family protein [Crocosphaera sp.]|nr:element excision factor XisH family protein [Crocosphaera sp.]
MLSLLIAIATVKNSLIKDDWTILCDPYTIKYEKVQLFTDLLADRTLEIKPI